MPMYEIERAEQGVRHLVFRVFADNEDDALERTWEEDIEPQTEYFKQYDAHTGIQELLDCDCDVCRRRGAWSCQLEEDM